MQKWYNCITQIQLSVSSKILLSSNCFLCFKVESEMPFCVQKENFETLCQNLLLY